jgi:hypothetical protein
MFKGWADKFLWSNEAPSRSFHLLSVQEFQGEPVVQTHPRTCLELGSFSFFVSHPNPSPRTVGDSRRRIIIWSSNINNTVQFYSSVRSGICYLLNAEGTIHLNPDAHQQMFKGWVDKSSWSNEAPSRSLTWRLIRNFRESRWFEPTRGHSLILRVPPLFSRTDR